MAAITAAIGLGIAAVGVGTQIYGASKAADANEQAIAAQQHSEQIKLQANAIDADRRRRQFVREGVIARASALSTTTNQGANQSSGLQGAYGQIAGRTSFGISGVDIAQATGLELFNANQDLFQAKQAGNQAAMVSGIGSGLTSLGGAIVGNIGPIDRVFGSGANGGTPNQTSYGGWTRSMGSNGIY